MPSILHRADSASSGRGRLRNGINRFGRIELLDDPLRHLGEHVGMLNLKAFGRPPNDIAAYAACIDMAPYLANAAADTVISLEEQVAAARSCGMRAREREICASVPLDSFGVLQIGVDHHKLVTSRHADKSVLALVPPILDYFRVRRRVLEAAGYQGRFRFWNARKHGMTAGCELSAVVIFMTAPRLQALEVREELRVGCRRASRKSRGLQTSRRARRVRCEER